MSKRKEVIENKGEDSEGGNRKDEGREEGSRVREREERREI